MAKTLAAGVATPAVRMNVGETRGFAGTLTSTATLSPEVSFDNGANYVGVAAAADGVAVAYTASFATVMFTAPCSGILFRVRNTAGAGSWSVEGFG